MRMSLIYQTLLMLIPQVSSYCEVLVDEPWPRPYVFAPENSTILINCTTTTGDSPLWSIDLASDGSNSQLQFSNRAEDLNAHGVYELPLINGTGTASTLRLLINDTASNNGTKIVCDDGNESFVTTLYIYEPTALTLNLSEMSMHAINISWHPIQPASVSISHRPPTYLLTIRNTSSSEVITVSDPYYIFTAPSCEVYNFSVTEWPNYVGATYTGASCSVPSPVLSMMLPSLPDTSELESSLRYHLVKLSDRVIISVLFERASVCGQYPELSYSLEVRESMSADNNLVQTTTTDYKEIFTVCTNLSENTIYSFRIVLSNNMGFVFSDLYRFYTTDIQRVSVGALGDQHTFLVQCDFITGSNAQGCMVVLVGKYGNVTLNLSRNDTTKATTIVIVNQTHHYFEVFGFDIEGDGTIGKVAIPGQLRKISVENHNRITHSDSDDEKTVTRAILASLLGLSITINIVFVIIAGYKIQKKKCPPLQAAENESQARASSAENIETSPNEVYGIAMTASRLRRQ